VGASLAAVATHIIRIRFTASNDGPIDPIEGSFEFEVTDRCGGIAGRFSPTVVTVNYGTFTTVNVVGFFDVDPGLRLLGGLDPTVGGPETHHRTRAFSCPVPTPSSSSIR
jgi:hypothetical protein